MVAGDRQHHSCWAHPTSAAASAHGHDLLLAGKSGACTEAFASFPRCFPAHHGVTHVCIKNDTPLNPAICFLSKNQTFLESLSPVQGSTREISLPISSFTGHLS